MMRVCKRDSASMNTSNKQMCGGYVMSRAKHQRLSTEEEQTRKQFGQYTSESLTRMGGLVFLLLTNESIIEKEGRRILKRCLSHVYKAADCRLQIESLVQGQLAGIRDWAWSAYERERGRGSERAEKGLQLKCEHGRFERRSR